MQHSPLTLGFIGGGLNSAVGRTHAIACRMDDHFTIASGCFSRDDAINIATASQYSIPRQRTHNQWQTMLEKEKGALDAIVVLTPTPTHFPIVKAALAMGYPVICEKALTSTVDEAHALKQLVEQHNGFLAVTFNYTGYPMLRELRHKIQQGEFGKIQQIHIEMPQEGFIRHNSNGTPNTPQTWRLSDGDIPTVSLDLGVHLHHIIHFLTGQKPLRVQAAEHTYGAFHAVKDNVLSTVEYADNLTCHLWYGKSALGYKNGLKLRLLGSQGSAEWYQATPENMRITDIYGSTRILERGDTAVNIASEERYTRFKAGHPAGFLEAFANYYTDIADSLRQYSTHTAHTSPYVFGADVALEGLKLLKAISTSSQERRWVEL